MLNFIDVSERSEELLHLEIEEVEAIMSDENLNVIKEETVWKAAIRWIDFDRDNRKQYISRLFKCVRTGLVDTDFFVEKIKACKYVAEDEACRYVLYVPYALTAVALLVPLMYTSNKCL
ncbi:hypothetical protein MTO96_044172 [Rhipicephalus appendiculatus]